MPSNASIKIDLWLTVIFGGGLYYFYKGFGTFREYRVLMDTPEIPIRSVAMGLVEIHGKAAGTSTIPSPVSQTPCYFYKVDIEQWVTDKNGGRWSHVATDADGPRFYISDSTGKVLVDAHHAEYDLPQCGRFETGRGPGLGINRVWTGLSLPPQAGQASQVPPDLWTYASNAVARHKGAGLFGGATRLGERYRLTEYLIIPDHWYDVTGTCVENPEPQDEDDRNLIVKGTNEPTFLITFRSEKEIRHTLRNRAAKYIFGGAMAAVVCLAIFLAKHGAF